MRQATEGRVSAQGHLHQYEGWSAGAVQAGEEIDGGLVVEWWRLLWREEEGHCRKSLAWFWRTVLVRFESDTQRVQNGPYLACTQRVQNGLYSISS